jgi:DegV family protein with EDD domain
MVKIITDTTACLPPEMAEKYQIPVIPQVIIFGEDSYYEGLDIDIKTFMQRMKASKELPKTAAPPPELFVKEFKRLVPEGEAILCIHPSSEVSGTVRSAQVAAMDFPQATIHVIDTRTISSPLGTMVELALQYAQEGCEADEIVARLKSLSDRCRVYFLVSTLEYLARGGRIGGASALLGSVLQIKPILALKDGRVEQHERARTYKRALQRLKALALEQAPTNGEGYLSIMHAGVPDEAQKLAQELGAALKQPDVPVRDMPPAIVTHGGPGILGIAFFVKE